MLTAIKSTAKFAAFVALGTFALASLLCGVASLWVSGDAMAAAVCMMAVYGSGSLANSMIDD